MRHLIAAASREKHSRRGDGRQLRLRQRHRDQRCRMGLQTEAENRRTGEIGQDWQTFSFTTHE